MMPSKKEIAAALERGVGDRPPDPGSYIERFSAPELALVLEREIEKAQQTGTTQLRLTMNLIDCAALAKYLRRSAILGA